ncbi:MAG: DUF92 domain-containing protein [bacterium]
MDWLDLATRVGFSVLPNLGLGLVGLWVRAFDRSGFLAGVILGSLITYAFGLGGFFGVLAFVVMGSVTTRLKSGRQAIHSPEADRAGATAKTWKNAVANLGVPAFGALLEAAKPVPLLGVFAMASLATAAFNTVSSEMGKTYAERCFTLQDLKVKPAGTPGGVSAIGTLSGVAASLAVAMIGFGFGLVSGGMVAYVVLAALLATAAESLLKSAAGMRSTHLANLTNTLLGGLIAALFWTGLRGT